MNPTPSENAFMDDDIDPIAVHHLALSDPDAGALHGVYVGVIDEPFGYTDPAVPAAPRDGLFDAPPAPPARGGLL